MGACELDAQFSAVTSLDWGCEEVHMHDTFQITGRYLDLLQV